MNCANIFLSNWHYNETPYAKTYCTEARFLTSVKTFQPVLQAQIFTVSQIISRKQLTFLLTENNVIFNKFECLCEENRFDYFVKTRTEREVSAINWGGNEMERNRGIGLKAIAGRRTLFVSGHLQHISVNGPPPIPTKPHRLLTRHNVNACVCGWGEVWTSFPKSI